MKVLIKFSSDFICFYDYAEYKLPEYSRTNVLDLHEIVLSDNFVDENYSFIYNFIKNKVIRDNIYKVFIDKTKINKLVFKLIYNIDNLKYIYINEEKKIDIDIFKYLLNSKYIETINCFDISQNTFERLNLSKNIKIITRKKYCNNSYLYRINNMVSYSDVYYKKEIIIDKLLQKKDLTVLNDFLKNNNHLNTIYIKYFNKENLDKILKMLKSNKKKAIKIEIIENDANIQNILNNIDYLRKKNKSYLKKNKINIKIKYEDKYIKNNLFKELNLNFIKTILLFVILITFCIYILFYFINKKHVDSTIKTTEKINDIIKSIEIEEPEKNKEEKKEEIKEDIKTEKPKEKSAYFKNYSKAINELKKINGDTVGWLTLNNTGIDYPVVKANNNDKYLDYSFDGKRNPNGWIFMDYRNNPNDLDKNTVIYGHSGNYYVMFGSLSKVLNQNWYTNSNNQTITFNTENNNKKWQIFSIYTIDVTSDYLVSSFEDDDQYLKFLTKLKERSIYDFGQQLDASDKILTLSTCYKDSDHRLVVHAKLIK